MNERIKELAEQATNDVKDEFGHWINNEFNKEKFAQLMAAECISVVTNLSPDYPLRYKNNLLIEIHHRDQIEEMFRGDCVEKIKQHFGVETKTIVNHVKNLGALDQYDDPIWQGKQL